MQRLGLVLSVSPSRNIIAKAEKNPKIGDLVVDESLKHVGRVFDILGPVSAPYVAVKPAAHDPQKFLGKTLYVFPSKRRKEKVFNDRG